jgi:trimeric autotransporter adhesin
MKTNQTLFLIALTILALGLSNHSLAEPLGRAFSYQGRLTSGGAAANGHYDMQFALFDAATNGTQVGESVDLTSVPVTNGLFTVSLDFGGAFDGQARWLEISLNPAGGEAPTVLLAPRQPVTATPYALNAANLMSAALEPIDIKAGGRRALRIEPTWANTFNIIAGYENNSVAPEVRGAVIAGGGYAFNDDDYPNSVSADFGVIGGGFGNRVDAELGVIGGGCFNHVVFGAAASVIGGGHANGINVGAYRSTISGGYANFINTNSDHSAIGGGYGNVIASDAQYSTIAGGYYNHIGLGASDSAIAGGRGNNILGGSFYGFIGGGNDNAVEPGATIATIGGGEENIIHSGASASAILGGEDNEVLNGSIYASIGGGYLNIVGSNSVYSVMGGGRQNQVGPESSLAVIAGGGDNIIYSNGSAIGGGQDNTILAFASVIAGGFNNSIGTNAQGSAILGGVGNEIRAGSLQGFIGGGNDNAIGSGATFATIGGGYFNIVGTNAGYSVIGGGSDNSIGFDCAYATIAGGIGHAIESHSSAILGGDGNRIGARSALSTITGGLSQQIGADSANATIAGGGANVIGSNSTYGTIVGGYANAVGDNSGYGIVVGGFANFATNHALAAGTQAKAIHTGAFVWGDTTVTEVASSNANSVTMCASGGYRLFSDGDLQSGVFLAPGAGSWTTVSDRNAKENFEPVDSRGVLDKVATLPLTKWKYKTQTGDVRHIGPMAQDFKAAFGVGETDIGITTIDADGVALAAIQGLNQKLEAEVKARDAENARLKHRLGQLEELVHKLSRP